MTDPAPPPDANADADAEDLPFPQAAWAWVKEVVGTWGPALLAVLLIRSVLAEPFRIPSGSMVPTLAIGDHILVTKYSYGFRWPLTRIPVGELDVPARGDVVVFVFPGSDTGTSAEVMDLPFPPFATLDFVKRVVGLPGDTLEVHDNQVYLNGKPQVRTYAESYTFVNDSCRAHATKLWEEDLEGVKHAILTSAEMGHTPTNQATITVPPGHVFVMGDNRDHSADSRTGWFVPLRNIKGKARFVWLSYDQCQSRVPLFGEFRGDRFGAPVR